MHVDLSRWIFRPRVIPIHERAIPRALTSNEYGAHLAATTRDSSHVSEEELSVEHISPYTSSVSSYTCFQRILQRVRQILSRATVTLHVGNLQPVDVLRSAPLLMNSW